MSDSTEPHAASGTLSLVRSSTHAARNFRPDSGRAATVDTSYQAGDEGATVDSRVTAEQITAIAVAAVGCDHGGLMAAGNGRGRRPLALSNPVVGRADSLQYELGEGPSVSAADDLDVFLVNDLAVDPRWPTWGPRAAQLGLGGLLAAPIAHGRRTIAMLNLYSTEAHSFTPEHIRFVRLFAPHAAATLLGGLEVWNLRTALDARTIIGQAEGILMARFGLNADGAFAVLKRYSQDQNLKLRCVAKQVVACGGLPSPHRGG